MSEFVISSEQLERLIEAIKHDTGREINRLVIDGVRAQEIVRCRDCLHYDAYGNTFGWCAFHDIDASERRFCAWGERHETWITCKCGEQIELGDRESAVCPSCGRTVRE